MDAAADAARRWEELKERFAADPLAQRIGAVILPAFGGYNVRSVLGVSGCLALADALRSGPTTFNQLTGEGCSAVPCQWIMPGRCRLGYRCPNAPKADAMQVCEGHGCAEPVEEVNVESWEVSGKILCADCADADFERRAQEGADPTEERG